MAKKIIILGKQNISNYFEVSYLLWVDVPLAQQTFRSNPDATSQYKGATASEITALKDGSIVEMTGVCSFIEGTPTSAIKSELIGKYNAAQNDVNADTQFNYYGVYYNGTNWANP
jgi:hypothetical protein